jgi:hypothetical protein
MIYQMLVGRDQSWNKETSYEATTIHLGDKSVLNQCVGVARFCIYFERLKAIFFFPSELVM